MTERFKKKSKSASIWTKNYTIMTLGSFISYMGNSTVSFILGILVLEYSNSVFLYGLYRSVYYISRIIVPILAGTLMNRLPRQKTIYILDFASFAIFLTIGILLRIAPPGYITILIIALILGCFDCCYVVTFGSLYPTLVAPENLGKAYSVYSILEISSGISIPIAALLYRFVDASVIFLMAAALYLLAAVFKVIPKLDESKATQIEAKPSLGDSFKSLKEGITYLYAEKAIFIFVLMASLKYFAVSVDTTLLLPYCRERWSENGYLWYILISSFSSSGSFMGSLINTRLNIPAKGRATVAILLYVFSTAVGGIYYFLPMVAMAIVQYLYGLCSSTEYTLRMASIQKKISPEQRGIYMGVSTSLDNLGRTLGSLVAGAFGEFIATKQLNMVVYGLVLLIVMPVIIKNRKTIKDIYEQEAQAE